MAELTTLDALNVLDELPTTPTQVDISDGDESPKKSPEIIANPLLDNTKLIISTPLRNEMENGNLLRNVTAILSQHLPENTAVECNYLINGGLTKDNIAALEFLKKLISIQQYARETASQSGSDQRMTQQKIDAVISHEPDPLIQRVLHQAEDQAKSVSVSVVNDMYDGRNDMKGYEDFNSISSIRTLGMDYAKKRLPDPEAIFHMYDIDTVPENNNYIQNLLRIYNAHPEITYIFSNLTHLPAGQHKDMVADSPANTYRAHYNWSVGQGSPQITFRLKAADQIQAIYPGSWQRDEDRDTSYRLVGMFGDQQKDVLKLESVSAFPSSMASDRDGGFVDGHGRLEGVKKNGPREITGDDFAQYVIKDRDNVLSKIDGLTPEFKEKATTDLEQLRKEYAHHQQALTRFNRSVVRNFLSSLDEGSIVLQDGEVQIDEQKILEKTSGQSTLMYLRANKELLLSLDHDDLQLLRFYTTDSSPFPEHITELTPFQKSLREYLGIYDSSAYSIDNRSFVDLRTGLSDKRSIYEPILAEMLAISHIDNLYFREDEFLKRTHEDPSENAPDQFKITWDGSDEIEDYKRYDWRPKKYITKEYGTRADWMIAQLPIEEEVSQEIPTPQGQERRKGYRLGSIFEMAIGKRLSGLRNRS